MYVYCVYPAVSKNVGKLVRFKQKGQKQASFLAFHKCCQGCLLRGPRYISTSFILVYALRCTQLQGTRKVYSQAEKFIRLVRIKQKCIRIAYLYSNCTDCRIKLNIDTMDNNYFPHDITLPLQPPISAFQQAKRNISLAVQKSASLQHVSNNEMLSSRLHQ